MDKKLLKKELTKLGIPVVGNYVRKGDIKKVIASEIWENEEAMADDLVKEFSSGKDAEEIAEIREEILTSLDFSDNSRYGSWGKAATFTADGEEYNLIKDEDEAVKIAESSVKQDLEHEPEIFSQDFIKEHIYISDTDKRIISNEEADNKVDDAMSDDEILKEAGIEDEYENTEDEDEKEKMLEVAKEELRSKYSDEIESELSDPIKYFVKDTGIYSVEDLMKASFINIDVEKASKEAVSTDGWAHFLSHYDGNYETTNGGMVYFKE
jgi:hypothetical protein